MTVKQNCWEFKRCGREPGGVNVYKLGLCPATKEPRLHGVHGGEQAGRACWIVAGTFCGGKIEGTFARKYKTAQFAAFDFKRSIPRGVCIRSVIRLLPDQLDFSFPAPNLEEFFC